MNDLRISKKRNKYVILNYSDNRKQIGKGVTNKTDANILLKQLIADVATKKVVITNRFKFKDEYKRYAENRLKLAEDQTVRLSKASIKYYETASRLYIQPCFPDVYIDEVCGPVLDKFVQCLYTQKQVPWKTAKNVISKIKTFLRDADGLKMNVDHSVFNWKMSKQFHLQPEDDADFYPKETAIIQPAQAVRLIGGLYEKRKNSYRDLLKLTAIASFTYLGLRYSELKGIKKDDVNLVDQSIYIGGVFDHVENRFKKKTKKRASTRYVEIQNDYLPYITEWINKIKHLDNPYLFPSLKTKGPMSSYSFRTMLWETYEEYGLAKLEWKVKDNNNIDGKRNPGNRGVSKTFTIISSPFKDCPTKVFRHSLATYLVNAVKSDPLIDQNYVMNVLGHGDYKTTESIYGNHVLQVSPEERAARRIAVQKAIKLQITKN
jgi:integrase